MTHHAVLSREYAITIPLVMIFVYLDIRPVMYVMCLIWHCRILWNNVYSLALVAVDKQLRHRIIGLSICFLCLVRRDNRQTPLSFDVF